MLWLFKTSTLSIFLFLYKAGHTYGEEEKSLEKAVMSGKDL